MSNIEREPKTGIFRVRVTIPEEVRHRFPRKNGRGYRTALIRSLGIRDPRRANIDGAAVVAEFQAQISAARRIVDANMPFSAARARNIVAHYREAEEHEYRRAMARAKASRRDPEMMVAFRQYGERLVMQHFAAPVAYDMSEPTRWQADGTIFIGAKPPAVEELEMAMHGLGIDKSHPSYGAIWEMVRKARHEAAVGRVGLPLTTVVPPPQKPISFQAVLDKWGQRGQTRKAKDQYATVFTRLKEHVGHDDAAVVSDLDIIAWKDAMLASGFSHELVADHLRKARTLFRCAKQERLIRANPTDDVVFRYHKNPANRKRTYTEEEARLILLAARQETNPVIRWTPWLNAFSGTRISEVCGPMVSNVRQIDGVWCLDLDDAIRDPLERLKGLSSIRKVPLHPAILAEGFLDYVKGLPDNGPLFPDLRPDRYGKRGGRGSDLVCAWVRALGVSDRRIQPNHAWRHWHEWIGKKVGISKEHRYALQGHVVGDAGEGYGRGRGDSGFPIEVLYRECCKLPNPAA